MNNQHNPIARIVERLQERWWEATSAQPDYKLIRWMIRPDDASLINGFYQLESSPYGSIPDFFLVLFTPFKDFRTFGYELLEDLLTMWQEDETVEQTGAQWDTARLRELSSDSSLSDFEVLIEALKDFHRNFCREEQKLVLGVLPKSISGFSDFNTWLMHLGDILPSPIKVSLIDQKDKNYLKGAFNYFREAAITLPYEDTGLHEAVRQMATAGSSSDPEVDFRRCMFEMADGVAAKDMDHICLWGDKGIGIALKSGSKNFLASAYLIYAGFLMQLKKEEAEGLLDEGLRIAEEAYKEGDGEAVNVLLQLYGYKSAYHRIKGHRTRASRWLFRQAEFAVENGLGAYAISICKLSARLAKSAWEDEHFYKSVEMGYGASEGLSYEELRMTEIGTLAWHYADLLKKEGEKEKAGEIYKRMEEVLGKDWMESVVKITEKNGESVPDIRETIESLTLT